MFTNYLSQLMGSSVDFKILNNHSKLKTQSALQGIMSVESLRINERSKYASSSERITTMAMKQNSTSFLNM